VLCKQDAGLLLCNSDHGATTGSGADVDQEDFAFLDVLNPVVVILGAHNTLQECSLHVNFDKDLRHLAWVANNMANHIVTARKLRVHFHSNSEKSARHSIHQVVVIGLERRDLRANFLPVVLTGLSIACNVARANRDFITNLQAAFQDRATGNTATESLSILSRLVHIEGPNYDHVGRNGELAGRNRNTAKEVNNHVNVVLQLSRNGNNRCRAARAGRKGLFDFFVLACAGCGVPVFHDKIYLVLQHDNVLQLHDVDCN